MGPDPVLTLDVAIAEDDWLAAMEGPEAVAAAAARAAFHSGIQMGIQDWPLAGAAEAGVRLTGDVEIQELNRRYRDRDQPTNVLSFPALDKADWQRLPAGAPLMVGDVVVALQTMLLEAAAEAKRPADHLSHLVVHGMLHLLGFDHIEENQALAMEHLETEVLAKLGIADPYASGEAHLYGAANTP